MQLLGDDPAAHLDSLERAPLEERPARYLALHTALLAVLESPA